MVLYRRIEVDLPRPPGLVHRKHLIDAKGKVKTKEVVTVLTKLVRVTYLHFICDPN